MSVRLESGDEVWVGSAEDQILRKLSWYRMGGEVSDRQWRDVLSIITIQASRLDRADVLDTAEQAGLFELAERAFRDADSV